MPLCSCTSGSLAGLKGRTHWPAGVGAGVGGRAGVGVVGAGVFTDGSSDSDKREEKCIFT